MGEILGTGEEKQTEPSWSTGRRFQTKASAVLGSRTRSTGIPQLTLPVCTIPTPGEDPESQKPLENPLENPFNHICVPLNSPAPFLPLWHTQPHTWGHLQDIFNECHPPRPGSWSDFGFLGFRERWRGGLGWI